MAYTNPTDVTGKYTQDPQLFSPGSLPAIVAQPGGNVGVSVIQLQSKAQFAADFTEVAASVALTLGGAYSNGDTMTLRVSEAQLAGGFVNVVVPVVTGDTATTMAQKIAEALEGTAALIALGFTATNVAGVLTVLAAKDYSGNGITVLGSASGAETWTPSVSTPLAGGRGIVVPSQSFNFVYNGMVMTFVAGKPYVIDNKLLAALEVAGMPIA